MSDSPSRPASYTPAYEHGALDWQQNALCQRASRDRLRDFFPGKGSRHVAAKQVCAACPVTNECLEFALASDEQHGVWGGLNPRERARLARQRVKVAS